MIPNQFYLLLSSLLFCIGVCGVLVRRNLLVILMCIELMLNAVNLLLVVSSKIHNTLSPQVFVFFIMMVAAVEVAVGLALFAMVYRQTGNASSDSLSELKG